MFASGALNVAIGLICAYVVLSLTRSALNKIMTSYKEAPPSHTYHVLRCCFLLTFVLLAGCASIRGFPEATYNENDEIKALAEYHAPAKITEYVNAPNDNVKKSIRDNFVLARMRAMDIKFDQFLMALRQDNIPSKIGVAWAITGVSTAGGLVAGFPSQILSGVAAGLQASQAPVNEHVFYEKTMPVLFGQMEASRKVVKARILTGLSQPISEYPLPRALVDLEDYYLAGSIPGALINIAAASGESNKKAEQEIKEIKEIPKLVPIKPGQVITASAITDAIIRLKETDLEKVKKAIKILIYRLNLDPEVEPSNNFEKAKKQLWDLWQKHILTPANLEVFIKTFKEADIPL